MAQNGVALTRSRSRTLARRRSHSLMARLETAVQATTANSPSVGPASLHGSYFMVPLDKVRANFAAFDLLDGQVCDRCGPMRRLTHRTLPCRNSDAMLLSFAWPFPFAHLCPRLVLPQQRCLPPPAAGSLVKCSGVGVGYGKYGRHTTAIRASQRADGRAGQLRPGVLQGLAADRYGSAAQPLDRRAQVGR